MQDTEKYLIHAAITADGIVERSDVVGAIFGQTEGLLGDDLDLRDLQQSSKVGRIDVEIDSQNGQSFGTVTIASTLDRVKTAILAASLETITRVGPCRATVEVTDIEDVREAKRREVVERAKELLSESFDESVLSSTEILDEVKESVRIEDISEYDGLPAGPRVGESDAVVVVEGRADVLTLLKYGIKNAVAVEGTNVPGAVADLTQERTTTAFLDGDRGGRLILRELAQVGDVDHVAFAPEGQSVEDLQRHEVFAALRGKDPIDAIEVDLPRSPDADDTDGATEGEPPDPPTGSSTPESAAPRTDTLDEQEYEYDARDGAHQTDTPHENGATDETSPPDAGIDAAGTVAEDAEASDATPTDASDATAADGDAPGDGELSLSDHAREVIDGETGTVRLLDGDLATVTEASADGAFDAIAEADPAPYAVVIDGEFTQRLLDIAAQRGVDHAVAATTGAFVKKPIGVRLRTADQLASPVTS